MSVHKQGKVSNIGSACLDRLFLAIIFFHKNSDKLAIFSINIKNKDTSISDESNKKITCTFMYERKVGEHHFMTNISQ